MARLASLLALIALACSAQAQAPAGRPQMPPPFVSPELKADRTVVLRLHAPQAASVRLNAGDMPGAMAPTTLTKAANGVWEATVGPLPPGAYRYMFSVDGLAVIDPRNPATSESNNNVWSVVVVPGSEAMDVREVPHGSVAEVFYPSKVLGRTRRMHVYTPPGYETNSTRYPVFYLLHGASDSDDSWTSVGRANFILDNLIASGKAKPMIVVMPAGHTRSGMSFGGPRQVADEFVEEFWKDIVPTVEGRYRTRSGRANRAIAGLSMGGYQSLNIAIPHLDRFAYVGIYSSGLFGIVPMGPAAQPRTGTFAWEEQNKAALDDPKLRSGLKLLWFGTGKDDFLVETTRATVELFRRHGFKPEYDETQGAHTWLVWRDYLTGFAPRLFR